MSADLVLALRRKARFTRHLDALLQPPLFFPSSSLPSPTAVVDALRRQRPEPYRLPDGYTVHVNDDSIINPFSISNELIDIIRRETRNCTTREDKAKRIFDWMQEHINYDYDFYQDLDSRRYGTSLETLRRGEGVCGEQAFLYVSMARSTGLESRYVWVRRDYQGSKVNHGCASVGVERGEILVDPAYRIFDVGHCSFERLSDRQVQESFLSWRGR